MTRTMKEFLERLRDRVNAGNPVEVTDSEWRQMIQDVYDELGIYVREPDNAVTVPPAGGIPR